jgi:hypothetical protein
MKNAFLAGLLLYLSSGVLYAQELISTAGRASEQDQIQVSWSIGELCIQTYSSGGVWLTEGFHQTWMEVSLVQDFVKPEVKIKAFPNPVQNDLKIEISSCGLKEIDLGLYNSEGACIHIRELKFPERELEISFQNYPQGIYYLQLIDKSGNKLKNLKIIKY